MSDETSFENRCEELTGAVMQSLGIPKARSNQVRGIIEYYLIRNELEAELKKDVLIECTSAELLKLIRNEQRIDESTT
jgi:hypothetical protein